MAKIHTIKPSFSGGEASPSLYSRVDITKYATMAKTLKNFFVHPHGSASNRAGFYYTATGKYDGKEITLIPFEYSILQNYMLEAGDYYIRFYTNDGQLQKYSTWATATAYAVGDYVLNGTTYYYCSIAHTSGLFANDLAAGDWTTTSWTTGATYTRGDYVVNAGIMYYCDVTHIAAALFATDLAALRWTAQIIYEVLTPYSETEIAYLNYTQSADVLFLAHPRISPRTLTRYGATDFGLELYDFIGGPFMLQNTDTGKTLMASAVTGAAITLTATGFTFEETAGASHVDSLWQLSHNIEGQAVNLAAAGTSAGIKCGGTWRVISHGVWTGSFAIEKSTDGGLTWTNLRTFTGAADFNANTFGTEDMSDNALPFLVRINITAGAPNVDLTTDAFVQKGIAKITSVAAGGATATATVTREIGLAGVATIDWAEGAWSDYRGWPSVVEFHPDDRLVFANTKTQPQTSWMTKTGNYYDFSRSEPLEDSDGITVNLPARKVNGINGLVPLAEMIALTSSNEWGVGSQDNILSPTTIKQKLYEYEGSYGIRPVVIGNRAIYVQAMGQVIRDLGYEQQSYSFTGGDLSVLSNHLFDGYTIRDMTYQQNPNRLVWAVRSDGKLLSMTYMREQEVVAWTWHDTNQSGAKAWATNTAYALGNWVTHLGITYKCNTAHTSGVFADDIAKWTVTSISASFESVACIPHGTYDELWAVIRRDAIDRASYVYGANIIVGGTPSADSEDNGYTADKALDGFEVMDPFHYWLSLNTPMPHWWKYDLGVDGAKIITKLKLLPPQDEFGPRWWPAGYLIDFTFQGSNDDSTWTDVYSGTIAGSMWCTFTFANTVAYRYYRLLVTSNGTGGMSDAGGLMGIEAYGPGETITEVSGSGRRYIERMVPRLASTASEDQIFMDSAITYDGVPASVITGLEHLEGKTVAILADGNVMPQQIVTGGQITLDALYSKVHVGIPYTADLETLNIEVNLRDGTLQGRQVKVSQVTFRLLNSRGGWIGPDFNTLHEMKETLRTHYGTAVALLSADVQENLGGGYSNGGRICLRQIDPLPITVLAVIPVITPGGISALK